VSEARFENTNITKIFVIGFKSNVFKVGGEFPHIKSHIGKQTLFPTV
jgi:hypothetical protein